MILSKKVLLARTLDLLGPFRWLQRARWNGLLVFNYHRVGTGNHSSLDRGIWSTDAESFAEQVSFLKRHFDLVGPADLDNLFRDRTSRGVLLTFDDGYRDNYDVAFPILVREGAQATFFVTTGFIDDHLIPWWDDIAWMVHASQRPSLPASVWGNPELPLGPLQEVSIQRLLGIFKGLSPEQGAEFLRWVAEVTGSGRCPATVGENLWMTWEMLREMHARGMSFGGHTVTHPVLSTCSPERQKWEIETGKSRLEQMLETELLAFSYPVGQTSSFGAETKKIVAEAGFRYGFSFSPGLASGTDVDRFALPRVAVCPQLHPAVFRRTAISPSVFAR